MKKTLLFQGDSVTDAWRTEGHPYSGQPGFLGCGYPTLLADRLSGNDEVVINRGVSGNRVRDLQERWKHDCLDLHPDVLTVLIGINDTWRKYDGDDETPIALFESQYDDILFQANSTGVGSLILMEPFLLPMPEERAAWRVTLDPMIHVVRRLANKYGARLVPLDGVFAKAGIERGYDTVTEDGIHPTLAGHRLIADEWLRTY